MRSLAVLLLALPAGAAFAQYKCTAADGAITFQQTPCAARQKEQKLVVVPNGHPPPASGAVPEPTTAPAKAAQPKPAAPPASGTVDQRMRAAYDKQNQRAALEQAVTKAQDSISQHAGQRLQALAAAKRQFGDDPASASALHAALETIEGRFDTLGDVDDLQLKTARDALARWDAAQRAN